MGWSDWFETITEMNKNATAARGKIEKIYVYRLKFSSVWGLGMDGGILRYCVVTLI